MKTARCKKTSHALTIIELLAVVAVVFILVSLIPVTFFKDRSRVKRITCTNNLKQIGLAFRVWAPDQRDVYPMEVSVTNHGSMEFGAGPNMFRHFQVMSNELNSPKMLMCTTESDSWRSQANTFSLPSRPGDIQFLGNSNVSYFVGLDASDVYPQMFLTGDHNVTNGTVIKNGLLILSTNHPSGWTEDMHRRQGNVGLADGSVQSFGVQGLRNAVEQTGFETNRLAMP